MENVIRYKGEVYGYIKDTNGNKIEGSEFHVSNAVTSSFLNKLAARLGGEHIVDIKYLQTGTGDKFDTIMVKYETSGLEYVDGCQTISKSAGGDGAVNWVEFRGEYTAGSDRLLEFVYLAKNYSPSTKSYDEYWAWAPISKSLLTGQTAVIYWRITFSAS